MSVGLCRAKSKETGEWVKGSLIASDEGHLFIKRLVNEAQSKYAGIKIDPDTADEYIKLINKESSLCESIKSDSNTISEYIRFNDKNETAIFEKDIVRLTDKNGVSYNALVTYNFKLGIFCAVDAIDEKQVVRTYYFEENKYECEVLGNLFDNPELLSENHLTNYAKIRSMSIDELASFLDLLLTSCSSDRDCTDCPLYKDGCATCCGTSEDLMIWLSQEAKTLSNM